MFGCLPRCRDGRWGRVDYGGAREERRRRREFDVDIHTLQRCIQTGKLEELPVQSKEMAMAVGLEEIQMLPRGPSRYVCEVSALTWSSSYFQ